MNPNMNLAELRQRLEDRREELIRRRDENREDQIHFAETDDDVRDSGDDAVRDQILSNLQAATDSEHRELRGIDAALARIEDGSYGVCVSCGEEIDEARLMALPHAIECAGCASARAHEREAAPPARL
jgi:RNA polymerase-binding protein DksA